MKLKLHRKRMQKMVRHPDFKLLPIYKMENGEKTLIGYVEKARRSNSLRVVAL